MESLPVGEYIRLREQGKDHNDAVAHVIHTYGCSLERLGAELAEATQRHVRILYYLTNKEAQ